MNEFIRRVTQNLEQDRRAASFAEAAFDPDYFDPYLHTSMDSATRADRATRLRLASREREERA